MSNELFQDIIDRFTQQDFFRVVVFGASNTERFMPGCHWSDVLDVGLRHRFGRKFHIINAGVCGNTAAQGLARFDRDVAFYKPDMVIITFGGNEPSHNIPEAEYRQNLKEIVARVRGLGGIPVLQTYYKMDFDGMDASRAEATKRNMEIIREVAQEEQVHLVDQYALFDKADAVTHRYGLMLNAMHVNEAGNMLIGTNLLSHFGVDPLKIMYVSDAVIVAELLRRKLESEA